jgi:cyclic dehypoxanthinyl futalosine synthase
MTISGLTQIVDMDAVVAGAARLTPNQALTLYRQASIHDLGRWATAMADRIHGKQVRTYVIDRNINYTNICSAHCSFCAFKRDLRDGDAYTLSTQQLHDKLRQLVAIGGTQILLQGGMHPELPIEFYEDMLRGLKAEFPTVHVHGFSPPELVEFVAVFRLDDFPVTAPGHSDALAPDVWRAKLDAILRRLMAAGLDSIPGGGAEIFAPAVRRRIGIGKASAQQWIEVMAAGQRLGMFTSATMMFGHIEGIADRIDHLRQFRDAQDRAIAGNWPGRYVSFIAWPFQRQNTPLGHLPDWDQKGTGDPGPFPGDCPGEGIDHPNSALAGKRLRLAGSTDYLRTQALARLFLDNFHAIGSSWVTMGPRLGQLGLFFGANDLGSVMMEENVVSAAGTTYRLDEALLCHLIRSAGYLPAQRDNRYRILRRHEGPASPDLAVTDWSAHRTKLGKI